MFAQSSDWPLSSQNMSCKVVCHSITPESYDHINWEGIDLSKMCHNVLTAHPLNLDTYVDIPGLSNVEELSLKSIWVAPNITTLLDNVI